MRSWNQAWLAAASAALLLLGGCLGSPDDPVVGSQSEVITDATPLPLIPPDVWTEAPAGCEGLIQPDVQLGVAQGAPALVGVIASDDAVECVDSFDSVEQDLLSMGAGTAAERIRDSYRLTRGDPRTLMGASGGKTGDPSPQPNTEASAGDDTDSTLLAGELLHVDESQSDPSPQPNDDGSDERDPSPQPN